MTGAAPDAREPLRSVPGLPRRLACLAYETLLLFGIGLIPGAIGALFVALTNQQHPLQGEAALRTITFALYAIYFTWFWSIRGQTLPMQTWRIRVVTVEGGRLTQSRAFARFLASCMWVAPAVLIAHLNHWARWDALGTVAIGIVAYALLALLNPQHQFLHDVICGTRLVTVDDSSPPRS